MSVSIRLYPVVDQYLENVKMAFRLETLLSLLYLIYVHVQISSEVLKNAASVHFSLMRAGWGKEIWEAEDWSRQ